MKQFIRIFSLIASMLCVGFIFYEYITIGFGLLSLYLFIFFLISSIVTILIPTNFKFRYIHKCFSSFFIWFLSMIAVLGSLFVVNKAYNFSPVLFSVKYYWEEGVDVEFRRNETFRSLNHHTLGGNISYGEYMLQDSFIILKDKIKFGNYNMNDTLLATNEGILFKMEKPWRIEEGIMSYDYGQSATFRIINSTKHIVDSIHIKLSYTKQKIELIKLVPGQSIQYKFKMENPYVDGKYILFLRVMDEKSNQIQIRNLTNGFPIETIKSIYIHENIVEIESIFGNVIKKQI